MCLCDGALVVALQYESQICKLTLGSSLDEIEVPPKFALGVDVNIQRVQISIHYTQ